jgi:hypothetical protein
VNDQADRARLEILAARVHDHYQSFFPTDVRHVANHAVRAIGTTPTRSVAEG